jgi:hypothetical protein
VIAAVVLFENALRVLRTVVKGFSEDVRKHAVIH